MIIDCISDLHGSRPPLPGGDLLIVAGDLTARDTDEEHYNVVEWLCNQEYEKIIVIAGNHDNNLNDVYFDAIQGGEVVYLEDSGTEFEYQIPEFPEEDEGFLPSGKRTLKIWGSPWTPWFEGVNPICTAFMIPPEQLKEKWYLIPEDTDILITHCPPKGILDQTKRKYRVGCPDLRDWVMRWQPKLHVFGHIHEGYGKWQSDNPKFEPTIFVNAAHMSVKYQPDNPPIRITL